VRVLHWSDGGAFAAKVAAADAIEGFIQDDGAVEVRSGDWLMRRSQSFISETYPS